MSAAVSSVDPVDILVEVAKDKVGKFAGSLKGIYNFSEYKAMFEIVAHEVMMEFCDRVGARPYYDCVCVFGPDFPWSAVEETRFGDLVVRRVHRRDKVYCSISLVSVVRAFVHVRDYQVLHDKMNDSVMIVEEANLEIDALTPPM